MKIKDLFTRSKMQDDNNSYAATPGYETVGVNYIGDWNGATCADNQQIEKIYHRIATDLASNIEIKNIWLHNNNFRRLYKWEYNLNLKANKFQSAYDLHYMEVINLMKYGVAMSYFDFSNELLYTLDLTNGFTYKDGFIHIKQGTENLVLNIDNLIIMRLKPNQIMNVTKDSADAMAPYVNLISKNLDAIETMLAGNGSISMFVKLETNISNEKAALAEANWVKAQFKNALGGIGFLQKGQEVKELSRKYELADKEQIKWLQDEIYSAFGLNENLFNCKFSEQEYIAYYKTTLKPIMQIMSTAYNEYFYQKDKYYKGYKLSFSFNLRDAALIKDYAAYIDKSIWNGIMSINTVLLENGQDPLDTPAAWEHYINLNVQSIANDTSNQNQDDTKNLVNVKKLEKIKLSKSEKLFLENISKEIDEFIKTE